MRMITDPTRFVRRSMSHPSGWLAAILLVLLGAPPIHAQSSAMQRAVLQGQSAARDSAQKYYVDAARIAAEGRYGPAIAQLRKAMEFLPNEPQLKVDMAVLLMASGDKAGAVRELEPLAEQPSPYGPAVIQLGDFELGDGDTTAALAYYGKLTIGPDPFSPALLRMGDVAQAQGKRMDAARYYREATRTDSTFIEAWLSLGSVYVIMDRYAEGLRAFDRAVAVDPANNMAQELQRLAIQRKEEYDEGLATGKMRARIIVTETREDAARVRQMLANGADFIALATNHSIDPTAQVGGDLGFFAEGEMIPVFEQAVKQLNPGEISPVLNLPSGYGIILRVN